jgi:peptidoglycan/LPS O-acetylase OafA/YrhL
MKNHIPALDGLRGLAALMVMWFHFFQNPSHVPDGSVGALLTKVNTIGQTGVDLFFVLSGFLITRILLSDKKHEFYFRNFYIKRSLRILPLYYFFLLFYLFVNPLLLGSPLPKFSDYWWWFVYLQNIPFTFGVSSFGPGHYWSLAVEEHFYLIWPLLVFLLGRRSLMMASLSMIAFSFGLRFIFLLNDWSPFYFTLTRLDALSMGTILALIEPSLRSRSESRRKILPVVLVAWIVPLIISYVIFTGSAAFIVQLVKYPLIAGFYFILIAYIIVSQDSSLICRIFSSKAAMYIGGISYGLYVYHGICFDWFDKFLPDLPLMVSMPCSFILSIIVAHISFRVLERPFLRLKRRLVKQGSNKAVLPTANAAADL